MTSWCGGGPNGSGDEAGDAEGELENDDDPRLSAGVGGMLWERVLTETRAPGEFYVSRAGDWRDPSVVESEGQGQGVEKELKEKTVEGKKSGSSSSRASSIFGKLVHVDCNIEPEVM